MGPAGDGTLLRVFRYEPGAVLRRKLQGFWNYYGVIGNSMMTARYQRAVFWLFYKWLNRRSQRHSMTWKTYLKRWPTWKLPMARVVEQPLSSALHPSPKPA